MPKLIQDLETWGEDALDLIKTAWTDSKPAIIALGETFAVELEAAAEAVLTGGASLPNAVASLLPLLETGAEAAAEDILTALGLAVGAKAAQATSIPAGTPGPTGA